ncbi:hypothetical protein I553_0060 [Mycobacterium xenopi 4042]|uniref:Uncharacterized protein n=1 Tax=Mycobacterium xenopi 4042 TaxID=1299334 RepID=X8DBD2_MYCXE|nr:hypothetical protein I553_0060 [Mycobacterium xenopi 4042]
MTPTGCSDDPRPPTGRDLPHARLHTINDSSTYVMLDQPAETASAISEFVAGAVR